MSNSFIMNTYILGELYNEACDHFFKITVNDKEIFSKKITQKLKYSLKINKDVDFETPGTKKLNLSWTGEKEASIKYFKLNKILINNQPIPVWKIKTYPVQNEYIKELRNTATGRKEYKNKLLYPGFRHGWYGKYSIDFNIGNVYHHRTIMQKDVNNFIGAKNPMIYLDKKYQRATFIIKDKND